MTETVTDAIPTQYRRVTEDTFQRARSQSLDGKVRTSPPDQPPRGTGRIRTIRIGGEGGAPLIDLQPCGGTHVANTSEIGGIVVTKIEKKSATTRRVVLGFAQ